MSDDDETDNPNKLKPDETAEKEVRYPRAQSIHDNVDDCDDPICCCAPEPRWQAIADDMEEERTEAEARSRRAR